MAYNNTNGWNENGCCSECQRTHAQGHNSSCRNNPQSVEFSYETRNVRMIKLGDHTLYIRSMGKALRVLAIAETVDEANRYCKRHSDAAVVAEIDNRLILIADKNDHGETIGGKRS